MSKIKNIPFPIPNESFPGQPNTHAPRTTLTILYAISIFQQLAAIDINSLEEPAQDEFTNRLRRIATYIKNVLEATISNSST